MNSGSRPPDGDKKRVAKAFILSGLKDGSFCCPVMFGWFVDVKRYGMDQDSKRVGNITRCFELEDAFKSVIEVRDARQKKKEDREKEKEKQKQEKEKVTEQESDDATQMETVASSVEADAVEAGVVAGEGGEEEGQVSENEDVKEEAIIFTAEPLRYSLVKIPYGRMGCCNSFPRLCSADTECGRRVSNDVQVSQIHLRTDASRPRFPKGRNREVQGANREFEES